MDEFVDPNDLIGQKLKGLKERTSFNLGDVDFFLNYGKNEPDRLRHILSKTRTSNHLDSTNDWLIALTKAEEILVADERLEMLEIFAEDLENRFNPETKNRFLETTLCKAAEMNVLSVAKKLVEMKANACFNGSRALVLAADNGSLEMVKLLYPVSRKDVRDVLPIIFAMDNPKAADVFDWLFERMDLEGMKDQAKSAAHRDSAAKLVALKDAEILRSRSTATLSPQRQKSGL